MGDGVLNKFNTKKMQNKSYKTSLLTDMDLFIS